MSFDGCIKQKIARFDHFAKLGKGDEVMERAHSVGAFAGVTRQEIRKAEMADRFFEVLQILHGHDCQRRHPLIGRHLPQQSTKLGLQDMPQCRRVEPGIMPRAFDPS